MLLVDFKDYKVFHNREFQTSFLWMRQDVKGQNCEDSIVKMHRCKNKLCHFPLKVIENSCTCIMSLAKASVIFVSKFIGMETGET